MDLKQLIFKIPFWFFCIFMFYLFVTGILHPVETNYWIVSHGIPIFIIEFLSIFTTLLLLVFASDKADERLNIEVYGPFGSLASKKPSYLIGLILLFIMAFVFLFIFSIWIFAYFVVSHVVKYLSFKNIRTDKETNDAINFWGASTVSFLLAALISAFSMGLTSSIFSEQIKLISQNSRELFENAGGTGSVSIEWIILWGILYFIMLIFFSWLSDYYENKTGKPFVRTIHY